VTLVAWGALVLTAVDFGRQARSGEADAWTFLALAAVGAAACLSTTLILGAKLVGLVRGTASPPPPARVPGGHRAAR
jgi:cytosine/uracil/thiamine/allantoin permease